MTSRAGSWSYGSVCSGIEAASVAWCELGWSPRWFSEIARFPSAVLAHRHPETPNHGSLVGLADRLVGSDREVELIVGGTPCQAFSIAGLRGGLSDERGNLTLEFARLAEALRPRWLLWENVPGVLSDKTNAFGCFLGALSELGYGLAWRVLDAQFFGVAQRRQRVFLVGYLGAAAAAGAVLFEPEGVRRNPPTRGQTGQDVAGTLGGGSGRRGWCSDTDRTAFVTASFDETQVTSRTNRSSCDPATAALTAHGRPPAIAFNARQDPVSSERYTGALDSHGNTQAVCVPACSVALRGRAGGATAELGGEVSNALRSANGGGSAPYVFDSVRVRRLTPRECERLQGFPDDYTALPGAKDSPRYAALGNSMAVPVMRWLGERIARVDAVIRGDE